ncbi:MAG: DUF3793 family protein [Treponema sp.]|jgi:hypothetical protein|nr:DUF3793 family protein [Treponema sp.]
MGQSAGGVPGQRADKRILAQVYSLIPRLDGDLQRLEAFIRWAAGPAIAGIKSASLIRIPCPGLSRAWKIWGTGLCASMGVHALSLREGPLGILALLFRRRRLMRKTMTGAPARYLRSLDYPVASGLDPCLAYLKGRFGQPGCFPHEVGVFLGYPLEDVIAFRAGKPSPYACHGYWKVYHRPERAQRAFAYMDAARLRLVREYLPCNEDGLPLTSLGNP